MNSSGNMGMRPVGVRLPEGQTQSPSTGEPLSVVSFARAETYAVEYYDQNGAKQTELLHCVNGSWWQAPNGRNYAAQLKPLSPNNKLVRELEERRQERVAAPLPLAIPKDAVNV